MIDINELRRLAQRKDQMDSLISRLQRPGYDLQKEQAIQEAIVVLQQLNAEQDALLAKIEQMEQQKPVGCVESLFDDFVIINNNFDRAAPVYLAPGAQPTPSIPGAKGEQK